MKKFKRSIIVPIALLIYLAGMSYIGFPYFKAGKYLFYFGIIGSTLIIIVLLHYALKRKEKLRKEREDNLRELENKEETKS